MAKKINETSIYKNLSKLRHILFYCINTMDKRHRITYGDALQRNIAEAIKEFALAYMFKEEKKAHLDKFFGWFLLVEEDIRFCLKQNIFHLPKQKEEESGYYVHPAAIKICTLIENIDNETCKYRGSLG